MTAEELPSHHHMLVDIVVAIGARMLELTATRTAILPLSRLRAETLEIVSRCLEILIVRLGRRLTISLITAARIFE